MTRWTILSQSAPDYHGNVTWRGRDGARVANVTLPAGQDPTDALFDADFAFAALKHRTAREPFRPLHGPLTPNPDTTLADTVQRITQGAKP